MVCAHLDSKHNTPGALDNAAGLVVLRLLAERLGQYEGDIGVELVALNGEEHYRAPGQVEYLKSQGDLSDIMMVINVDGPGYGTSSGYSLYNCPEPWKDIIVQTVESKSGVQMGEGWHQGDHMIFVQQGIPALAVTSLAMEEMLSLVHTARDTVEGVCAKRLVEVADCLYACILSLSGE